MAWCRRRSSIAAATVVSSKISPQPAMPRLVVRTMDPRLVAAADDLEEVAGGLAGHREVAELVNDEQQRSAPEAHRGLPASLERGLRGLGDEVRGGGVVDAVAGLHRLQAERDRQHRLADPGRPDEQDVGFLLDEPQRGELLDQTRGPGWAGRRSRTPPASWSAGTQRAAAGL